MKSTNIKIEKSFLELLNTVKRLRSDDGCPWDLEQTSESLSQYLLQETYEVLECIDNSNYKDLKGELGDLLFQILIQSLIGEEENKFSILDVIMSINTKLINRHPHVFGDSKSKVDSKSVIKNWGEIKKSETKDNKSYIKGISTTLPSLSFAFDLYRKSNDINIDLDEDKDFEDYSTTEIINTIFKLSSAASRKNIDLENEFRKYLKAKQLDIISKA